MLRSPRFQSSIREVLHGLGLGRRARQDQHHIQTCRQNRSGSSLGSTYMGVSSTMRRTQVHAFGGQPDPVIPGSPRFGSSIWGCSSAGCVLGHGLAGRRAQARRTGSGSPLGSTWTGVSSATRLVSRCYPRNPSARRIVYEVGGLWYRVSGRARDVLVPQEKNSRLSSSKVQAPQQRGTIIAGRDYLC